MQQHRFFTDALLLSYLVVTAAAFTVTMTDWMPSGFLQAPIRYSYGMMAPYQGASQYNRELQLVGYDDKGTATPIPLDSYFPGLRGEKNSRQLLDQFIDLSIENTGPVYRSFLEQIRDHEHAQGRTYASFQLWKERWPTDARGYRAGRERGVERIFLLRFP